MKTTYTYYRLLIFAILLLISCNGSKKKTSTKNKSSKVQNAEPHYLHTKGGKPIGSIRVECKDCKINYRINKTDSTVHIKDGNEDRFIYSQRRNYVKTELISYTKQRIRLLVIDPNGNILYNVLDDFKKGQVIQKTFLMQYTRKPNTILLNIN